MAAAKTDLGITAAQIKDADIERIFRAVDTDGSGTVEIEEFVSWLNTNAFNQETSSTVLTFSFLQYFFMFCF